MKATSLRRVPALLATVLLLMQETVFPTMAETVEKPAQNFKNRKIFSALYAILSAKAALPL